MVRLIRLPLLLVALDSTSEPELARRLLRIRLLLLWYVKPPADGHSYPAAIIIPVLSRARMIHLLDIMVALARSDRKEAQLSETRRYV